MSKLKLTLNEDGASKCSNTTSGEREIVVYDNYCSLCMLLKLCNKISASFCTIPALLGHELTQLESDFLTQIYHESNQGDLS